MTIFVSVASYRDAELVPTIQDCLAKASQPNHLRFGVCWQHGTEQAILPVRGNPHIRILDVDWRNSGGACWARAEIMKLYSGEEYFLQIDSHHRFVQDWDSKLIQYMSLARSAKPILTTYCPMYTPGRPLPQSSEPTQMSFHYFTPDGIPMFRPTIMPNWRSLKGPLKARFVSGHFLFTLGSFVEEVPYDPHLYFHGEEITVTVRAYTWGYDFFHPPEVLLWHEYSREYRPKHWEDHSESGGIVPAWHQRDRASKERVRRLLISPFVGRLACGPVRTAAQYEAYAGISFRHRKVQDYTLRGEEPPNPIATANWHERIRTRRGNIELEVSRLPQTAFADAQFWCVGIQDSAGVELHRIDVHRDVLDYIISSDCDSITLQYEFDSGLPPAMWTIWPFSHTTGWFDKISGSCRQTDAY